MLLHLGFGAVCPPRVRPLWKTPQIHIQRAGFDYVLRGWYISVVLKGHYKEMVLFILLLWFRGALLDNSSLFFEWRNKCRCSYIVLEHCMTEALRFYILEERGNKHGHLGMGWYAVSWSWVLCWCCLLQSGFYIVCSIPVRCRQTSQRDDYLGQLPENMCNDSKVTYLCGLVMFGCIEPLYLKTLLSFITP